MRQASPEQQPGSVMGESAMMDRGEVTSPTEEGVGELEITPAQAAIARYLGIDLSKEGIAARYRKGLNLILCGAPFSGKSFQAQVITLIC